MRDTVTVHIDEITAATDKAVCVRIDEDEVWIPRSVIEGGDNIHKDDAPPVIEVAEWFAEKEGLA